MNKRLGTLVAVLVLVASAKVGSGSERGSAALSVRKPLPPVPAPCSWTRNPACRQLPPRR